MITKPTALQNEAILALKMALQQLDIDSLSGDIIEEIHHLEEELKQHNYQSIDNHIFAIIDKNPTLKEAYQKAYQELDKNYSSQEKDKLAIDGRLPLSLLDSPILLLDKTKTPAKINSKALTILQALEIRSLTIENLTYRLNLPETEIMELIRQLWNEGKIDTAKGNIFGKFIPALRNKKPQPDDYFTLTLKGRLQLKSLANAH